MQRLSHGKLLKIGGNYPQVIGIDNHFFLTFSFVHGFEMIYQIPWLFRWKSIFNVTAILAANI